MSEFKSLTTLSGNVLPGVPAQPGTAENAVRVTFATTLGQIMPGIIEARDVDIADAIEETARRMNQSEAAVTGALVGIGAQLNPQAVPEHVRAAVMAGQDVPGASALRAQWGLPAQPGRVAPAQVAQPGVRPVFGKRGTV